jgi:ribonuclease Z
VSELTDPPETSYSYAYVSDSIYDPSLVPLLKNVDLLYHESTFLNSELERAKLTHHSTAAQAAQIAKDAQVKKILLGHISARYLHREILFEEEARAIFPNAYLVEDGGIYSIY